MLRKVVRTNIPASDRRVDLNDFRSKDEGLKMRQKNVLIIEGRQR